jgi:hypothetical protein
MTRLTGSRRTAAQAYPEQIACPDRFLHALVLKAQAAARSNLQVMNRA